MNSIVSNDEIDITLQLFVAVFFDALGQKENLNQQDIVLSSEALNEEEIKKSIEATYSRVTSTRKAFYKYIQSIISMQEEQNFTNCHHSFNKEFHKYMSQEVFFEHMSDSIFIYFPLDYNREGKYNYAMLFHFMASIILLQTKAISEGIFFRGGIDIGYGALLPDENYASNCSLYGPILSRVAQLEAKHADWPRVVVGKNLNDLIQSGKVKEEINYSDMRCLDFYHDWCSELLINTDSLPMLKIFGKFTSNYFSDDYGKLVEKSILSIWENAKSVHDNHKVYEKYKTIFKYVMQMSR